MTILQHYVKAVEKQEKEAAKRAKEAQKAQEAPKPAPTASQPPRSWSAPDVPPRQTMVAEKPTPAKPQPNGDAVVKEMLRITAMQKRKRLQIN